MYHYTVAVRLKKNRPGNKYKKNKWNKQNEKIRLRKKGITEYKGLRKPAERAYNLRRNFVKDFKLNEKATSKNLENFLITAACLEDNCFDVEKFLEYVRCRV